MDLPIAQKIVRAVESARGDVILMPTPGRSLPLAPIDGILRAPVIIVPIANHDNNQQLDRSIRRPLALRVPATGVLLRGPASRRSRKGAGMSPSRRSFIRCMSTAPVALSGIACSLRDPGGAGARDTQHSGGAAMAQDRDGRGGFDFLVGTWRIQNRRLVGRLRGSTEWQEFEAMIEGQKLPGGLGNLDCLHIPRHPNDGKPYDLVDLKVFDPASQVWSMVQSDNRSGQLGKPLTGRFANGVGDFTGDDTLDGKPIVVRFRWHEITSTSARWEQAFSPDAGQTWETNWTMLLTRER